MKPRWLAFGMVLWFLLGGCGVKTKMPGKSFSGELPPMTEAEIEISRRLRVHVGVLGGEIGERNIWNPEALKAAAQYVEQSLSDLGLACERQEYELSVSPFNAPATETGRTTVANIDATQRGTIKHDEIVLVGAHYDSVRGSPGANDNATGVAAMLEIARILKRERPARTIRYVAFVNEEPPFFQTDHMGSVVYAKRCRQRR